MKAKGRAGADEQELGESAAESRRTGWLIGIVWLLMTLFSLVCVAQYALTAPFADELRWVPVISGEQPVTAAWLFQLENQHCIPAFKLFYLAAGWATDFDFRLMAILNVVLMAATAAAMLLALRRVRGRWSPLDAAIPIVLLHMGHYFNFLWSFQLFYIVPVAVVGVLTAVVLTASRQLTLPRAALVAACTLFLGLSGGPGVFYVPAIAAWLALAGVRRWLAEPAGKRASAVAILTLALLSLAPAGLYLANLSAALTFPSMPNVAGGGPVLGALQFLAMSLGKFGKELWPVSGIGLLLLTACLGWLLQRAWRNRPDQRLRIAGLGLLLAGTLCLAGGVGIGRGNMAPGACLMLRYMILGAPFLLVAYMIGALYGPAIANVHLRRAAVIALLALACWYNAHGLRHLEPQWAIAARLREDAAEGLSARAIAMRQSAALQYPAEALARDLELLRRAGLGPYRNLPSTPTLEASREPRMAELRIHEERQ